MDVSTLVRWGAALTLVGMAMTACSETPSAPQQGKSASAPGAVFDQTSGNKGIGRKNPNFVGYSVTFTVDPTRDQTFSAANYRISFPAGSICDPATSGYNPTLWDTDCAALTQPITITAQVDVKHGHIWADFSPSLRFVPSKTVLLTLIDAAPLPSLSSPTILWNRPSDGKWVEEGAYDPSMRSTADFGANSVTRRLKHFSGYLLSTGDACDPLVDGPDCIPSGQTDGLIW